MKDLARLEAASLSLNTSARLQHPPSTAAVSHMAGHRHDDQHDRVSVSIAAQKLNEQTHGATNTSHAARKLSLPDLMLAHGLKIDPDVIAELMLRE